MTEPNAWLQIGSFVLGAGQAVVKVAQYLLAIRQTERKEYNGHTK